MRFLAFLLSISLFPISVFSQRDIQSELKSFPSYETVSNYLKTELGGDTLGNTGLARRPDGWYLMELDRSNRLVGEYLIWSLTYRDYVNVDLAKAGFKGVAEAYPVNQNQLSRMFAIHPYWGYVGWDFDVIRTLKNQPLLSDTLMYGLARAYGNYAQGILRKQYAYHAELFPDAKYERLDPERVALIREYVDACLITYEALERQSPDFMTIVGNVQTKLANEYIDSWLKFSSIREPDIANSYLVDNLYPSYMIALARNYLLSCPEDAILFTNGDNDTYPLWYVQKKFNLRADVRVINLSLLNMPAYVDRVMEEQFWPSFQGIINDSTWYSGSAGYCLVIPDTLEPRSLDSLLAQLRINEGGMMVMQGRKAFLNMPGGSRIEMEFPNYLMASQLALLDIMASTDGIFPICFSSTSSMSQYEFLGSYLRNDGMVYRLMSSVQQVNHEGTGRIDSDVLYNFLMNDFDETGITGMGDPGPFNMTRNYRYMFAFLARVLAEDGDSLRFRELVQKFDRLFPSHRYRGEYPEMLIARGFYELGDMDAGGRRMEALLMDNIIKLNEWKNTPANDPRVAQVEHDISTTDNFVEFGLQVMDRYEDIPRALRVREAWNATKH